MIASGGESGTIRLWDVQGNPVGQAIQTNQDVVYSVAFSPDGKILTVSVRDTYTPSQRVGRLRRGSVRHTVIHFQRIGNWEDWLEAGCKQLRHHAVFRDPQSEIQQQAKATCQRHVWDHK